MLNLRAKVLCSHQPLIAICAGASPDRLYLNDRCWAEMEVELAGLPIVLITTIQDGGEWNESAAKNAAAAHAANHGIKSLLFTNGDIVIPKSVVEFAVSFSPGHPYLLNVLRQDEQPDGSWVLNEQAIGDCQFTSAEVWQKAEGFDERLTGWGFIDYSFAMRCDAAGAQIYQTAQVTVRHHWHPRLTDDEYRANNARNRDIACAGT